MGVIGTPDVSYSNGSFFKGFLEGYKTMDALASIVFGIVVINAIKGRGVTSKKALASACIKAGLIAAAGLTFVYLSLAYLGASSTHAIGFIGDGSKILAQSSQFPFRQSRKYCVRCRHHSRLFNNKYWSCYIMWRVFLEFTS